MLLLFLTLALAVPDFDAFKVEVKPEEAMVPLQRTTPLAKRYATVLTEDLASGPNFAGHYRLAQIGCGSSCRLLAIVDTRTGAVFDPHMFIDGAHAFSEPDSTEFKRDSALLILRGCINEKDNLCGHHYLKWTGKKLERLEFDPKRD